MSSFQLTDRDNPMHIDDLRSLAIDVGKHKEFDYSSGRQDKLDEFGAKYSVAAVPFDTYLVEAGCLATGRAR
jgi:hypothetical protein